MSKLYREMLEQLNAGQSLALETVVKSRQGDMGRDMVRRFVPVQPVTDLKGRRYAAVTAEREGDSLCVREPMLPQERLIVLGAGHIALPVCEFAAKSGFAVTVCDDRPDFANRQRFPDAEAVICDSFENAIRSLNLTPYDYVVIITRGHRHDANCLRVILPGTQPAYLGMIGSRRRVKGLFEMLVEEGYDRALLDRICTPIGLNIGAVTPGEIAISILSEVVAYKRLPEHSNDGIRCCNDSDVEMSTLRYLAENDEPKAVVTVVE
ncbi:MAG: XdhC family protein, partial [Oscillospiraceae bacterium]|nr:XdhC family protein [Oscillospiraceae bacterium]